MSDHLRTRFAELLAYLPINLRVTSGTDRTIDGIAREDIVFVSDTGEAIRGILFRPTGTGPWPGLVYAHAHGGRYDIGATELSEGRDALFDAPGPAFAEAGYCVLAIDMPTFGQRAGLGESSASKAALWHGKTLFGQMLGEQAGALNYLANRPDVIADRIGIVGLSMGATLAYWLGALEPRLRAVAHLCCYADFATLVETGAHDLHGHYLTVPGLLPAMSTGTIAGLVAPRPQLALVGTADALTPPLSVDRAEAYTRALYQAANAPEAFTLIREAGIGHQETATMRAAVLAFFAAHLQA